MRKLPCELNIFCVLRTAKGSRVKLWPVKFIKYSYSTAYTFWACGRYPSACGMYPVCMWNVSRVHVECIQSATFLLEPVKCIKDSYPQCCRLLSFLIRPFLLVHYFEPRHEISNNVVCVTSKSSDQPAHTRSLSRAFASRLNIL